MQFRMNQYWPRPFTSGRFFGAVLGLVLLICCACSNERAGEPQGRGLVEPKSKPPSNSVVGLGALMSDQIVFEFAIYFLGAPNCDPMVALKELLAKKDAKFTRVDELSGDELDLTVCAHMVDDVKGAYAPPDMESLSRFGRGLTLEQSKELQNCTSAITLVFLLLEGACVGWTEGRL